MGVHRFTGRDGVALVWHEIGSGRPLILLPGFGGSGARLLEYGPAGVLAQQGHRVILPDYRGCGASPTVPDRAGYPPDILADDGLALVEHLGLGAGAYDLGGYSLGGRIVARMLVRGAEPGRAIVAGQGLAKVSGPQGGGANHRALAALVEGIALEPDSPDARAAQMISNSDADPRALLRVLESLVPTSEADLRRITVPTLVVIGDRDERSDADELAALFRNARFVRVPGDHGSAFVAPEFTAAIVGFLAED